MKEIFSFSYVFWIPTYIHNSILYKVFVYCSVLIFIMRFKKNNGNYYLVSGANRIEQGGKKSSNDTFLLIT